MGSTTTLDPVTAEKADVAAVAVEARAARMAVLVDPDDQALVAALDTLYTTGGEARAEIDGRIASMADEGLTVAPDPEVPDALTVEGVVLAGDPPATATVTACVVESGIYSQVESPETSAVEVGREFRAFRARYAMVAEQGLWKVDTVEFIAEWPGETTCPPPPAATTTTLDPVAAEEALVAQRVHEIEAVRSRAYIDLDAPGAAAMLDSIYAEGAPAREILEGDLAALRDAGWRVREGPIPSSLTVESVSLLDGPPATRANVQVCVVDATVLYEPGGSPDGSDTVVNDDTFAFRTIEHLLREGDTWQMYEVEVLDEWHGAVTCPAEL